MRVYGGWSFRRAGKDYGWLLSLATALVAILMIYSKAPAEVGIPLPGDKTVAFSPGSNFDVAGWCKTVAETVRVEMAPDASGVRYVAARGAESVEWVLNPTGDADHYWRDSQGLMQHEGVLITEDARDCMSTARP